MKQSHLIAIELLMRHDPADHYDSGEEGVLPECRTCYFHRPYASVYACVFCICPYSAQPVSTRRPTRWVLAYISPLYRR